MKFIITVKEHRYLGYILTQHLVALAENQQSYNVLETVVLSDTEKYPDRYTPEQKQIAKLIDNYSDANIAKNYGGSKLKNPQDFFASKDTKYIEEYVRPAIDKKIIKILDICKASHIEIFFKDTSQKSILIDDRIDIASQKAQAVFNFERTENETHYYLTAKYKTHVINLLNKNICVLSYLPCVCIINNKLLYFDTIDAKKLLPFTTKQFVPVLKRVEPQYYEKFVKNAIAQNFIVEAKGFKIYLEDVEPKAVLVIEHDLQGFTVFVLKFRYKDLEFLATSKNYIVVKFYENNGEYYFTKLIRDTDFEQETENTASEIFGSSVHDGVYKLKHESNDKNLQEIFAINYLNDKREQLLQAGIEIEQNLFLKKYYTGKITLNMKVVNRNDWFDIFAVVKLEDIEIPFISLKYYIINDIRECTLPDGRVVILPEEWFDKYREMFLACRYDKVQNCITLKKYQYLALMNLPLEESDKERIKKLEKQLTDFEHSEKLTPKNIAATLRPYQVTAYNWLMMMRNFGFGACLADDMGLGKTLCTLSLLANSTAYDETRTNLNELFELKSKIPSLLLVPKSLIFNWKNEAKKFAPQIKILEYTGNNRKELIKSFHRYDIVIAAYGIIRNDIDDLEKQHFNYVILDESQYIKNSTSKTYNAIMQLSCNYRLTLTGTPLENSLTDLWSQMNFINPGLLGNFQSFKKRFVTPIEKNSNEEATEKLRKLIYPFILRRTKQQVLKDLPEKIEQVVYCEMSEQQSEIYEREKSKIRNSLLEIMEAKKLEQSPLLVIQGLTLLRQIACAPSLTIENYTGSSGKTEEIMRVMQSIVAQKHKILVFSSFVKHLELIANEMQNVGIDYAMLTGQTQNREKEVQKFNNNSDVPVFLISIKAGGTGMNLTEADYVFIIDPWWNPAVEEQAIARAHRMGQKNNVVVYRFISQNTLEEKIQKLQDKKNTLATSFVSETSLLNLSEDEVLDIIG
ncbi:MAG: DEAD/DEAH box helicase [Bacteroidales bacterium]|nr:DEAD/DEAH box helicase [Bacteroidales bacterium]